MEEKGCSASEAVETFREKDPLRTMLFFAAGDRIVGAWSFVDKLRERGAETCSALVQLGKGIHLCSGDEPRAVRDFANRIGHFGDRFQARMSPAEKREFVASLSDAGKTVLFVGDGLNDSPAMGRADLAVSMNGGIELTVNHADVVLLDNRIEKIPLFFRLSRQVSRLVNANLKISVIYNFLAIPLAVFGFVIPPVAAASMALSSLIVVGNSLLSLKTPSP